MYVEGCFTLEGWDGRNLVLRADNEDMAQRWVDSVTMRVFEHGAPPPPPDESGDPDASASLKDSECSDLATATISNDLETFKRIAVRKNGVSNQLHTVMDGNQSNLMHLACKNGSLDIVDFLATTKACGINSINMSHESPLFLAVSNGHGTLRNF